MIDWLHPGLILIIGALLVPLFKGKLMKVYLILPPLAALKDIILMHTRSIWGNSFLSLASTLFRI